jgi:selenocysteine lyase/cysteine desulfurase
MKTFCMQRENRRNFLRRTGVFSATALLSAFWQPGWSRSLHHAMEQVKDIPSGELATNEDFWYYVQQAFTVSPQLINLNNGGVSPQPKIVQDAQDRFNRFANEGPSYYMWQHLDKGRESLRKNLARLAGCAAEEIAMNRNASEALETVIFGLDLKRGDEVILTRQDYPNMINAWKQREMRDGIKLVWLNLELPSEDNDYLANSFINAFTPGTKLVQVTHVINWMGQIMPVKRIAQAAHKRGIEVLVDGAHSFAQFDFSLADLECDYFGTSLHKWLCAPFGTGVLYVKKDKIKNLFPLLAAPDPKAEDIRKFEALGTRSFPTEQAIGKAIEFHEMIGIERKQQRLQYLKNYWMEKVKEVPGVLLHTSFKPAFGCAIGSVSVKGTDINALSAHLLEKYGIHTVAINWENIHGVRITPNVYTTIKQLDILVEGITTFANANH